MSLEKEVMDLFRKNIQENRLINSELRDGILELLENPEEITDETIVQIIKDILED